MTLLIYLYIKNENHDAKKKNILLLTDITQIFKAL